VGGKQTKPGAGDRPLGEPRGAAEAPRQSDESLRVGEQRYRALLDALPAYVYSVRIENGRPVSTEHSLGSTAVTGYGPEDYSRDPNLWINMVHPEDRALVREFAARHLEGQNAGPIEHRIIHRDGRVRWVRSVIVPHYDAAGRMQRYDGLIEDVTARKQAEMALRETERIKAIGSLAGGVAQDFNAVLNAIAGNATSIADNTLPQSAAHEAAQHILEAAMHAGDVTKRLMGLARLCETGADTELEAVPVAEVVRNTIRLTESALAARRVSIQFRHPAAEFLALANAAQLLDALTSLFLNAADAMSDGGTIYVDVSQRRTTLPPGVDRTPRRGVFVVIRVRDTGHGIPPELMKRIFEPFFTTRQSRTAFGLGLTVVKNLVKGWGGWVSVRSRPGRGASFRLLIPKADQPVPGPTPPPGRCTVLLADDDAGDAAMMRRVLEGAGHTVMTAAGTEEAVAQHARQGDKIDVTIVDLLLPPGGGKPLVEAILNRDAQAAVIVISGFSREYARLHLPRGAWVFLQKPIEADKLLRTLASLRERRGGPHPDR